MQQVFSFVEAVVQWGSFRKAAEKLNITQPALSIAIAKEEKRIGMPLLDRSVHPIVPTDAGIAYLDSMRTIKKEEERLACRLVDIRNLDVGSVRLGGSHYFNAYVLSDVLSSFSRKYPGISLSVEEAGSDVLLSLLKENELDVTFSCNTSFMADFERYPLFADHLLLAVPKEDPFNATWRSFSLSAREISEGKHLLSSCPAVPLESLCSLSYILLQPGNNLYDRAMQFFRDKPRVKLMVSQLVTGYHLAQSGFAATFVCDRLVMPQDTLCYYKMDHPLALRRFYMLVAPRGYTSHALSTFIHYISAYFRNAG